MSNTSPEGNGADQPIDYRTFHYQLGEQLLLTSIVGNDGEELVRLDFVANTEWKTIQAIVANSIPVTAHVESHVHDMRDDLDLALATAIAGAVYLPGESPVKAMARGFADVMSQQGAVNSVRPIEATNQAG